MDSRKTQFENHKPHFHCWNGYGKHNIEFYCDPEDGPRVADTLTRAGIRFGFMPEGGGTSDEPLHKFVFSYGFTYPDEAAVRRALSDFVPVPYWAKTKE